MKQILDQINALQPGGSPLSPLKTLTQQLKRGRTRTRTSTRDPPSPELPARVDLVLKELQGLNRKLDSNLELLRPYVTFLRMAQQVEDEMEELQELYRKRPEEEEASSCRSAVKNRKQFDSGWEKTLQSFLSCQELGNSFLQTANTVSGSALNLQSVVQETLERLGRTEQEVNEMRSQRIIQIQEQRDYCRKYRERLDKTLQDLNCVSEMLDSCTLMDLGSDLQTSKLLERFSQARPHFTQLDAEVEFMLKSWETLRGEKVKKKIRQSESILDRTSSFHLTSRQLEALIQTLTGSCGSSEEQQQLQSLFKTTSTLKSDICTSVSSTGWTSFHVDQLEARLFSLDSLCVSWLKEASRREEKLRRERLLNDDINQLRESFKELKKRFSNLRFNYLKRNDRRGTRRQRETSCSRWLYEEKLQALRKRLGGATSRLGSEVRDGGVARETEDAVNELQRQMGELERSVGEHQKTLEMTCRLQTAMEEFWCDDAGSTIARVGKFSSECRSTEAVSVLHRQFEKFVWPTVPQQEERISQITELAVRLHG
ncbi:Coiled-coil domain containing protein 141 [Dissostichus eleginoides]|uniref:Coiled-coil domain containing protein 141 n=1 Tax=Dissostichus eleginoides TaxID=100907 RepID=A0AAD9CIA2_DISEL|nr:Coiled-coil domain containing protein 141 [Dissostichus eleginoides]